MLAVSSTVSYVGTNLGYDAAGRMIGYSYTASATASTETFLETYLGRDNWLEAAVAGSSTNSNDRPTTSTIAYDAAGRELSIRERTVYATIDDRWRYFANDEPQGQCALLIGKRHSDPMAADPMAAEHLVSENTENRRG